MTSEVRLLSENFIQKKPPKCEHVPKVVFYVELTCYAVGDSNVNKIRLLAVLANIV